LTAPKTALNNRSNYAAFRHVLSEAILGVLHWLDWLIIAVYLVAMVGIGVWLTRKHKNFEDFFLAGRALTTPILVTTLVSTYYGIDVLFGTSELGFESGVVAWFGYSRPFYIFFLLAAFLLANRLRAEDFKSLPDILHRYYGNGARYLGATASFVYSLPVLALFGFGKISHIVFGWDPLVGALILGGVALVYTLTGGFWAVALTDSIQFVLMCVVVAVVVVFAISALGGFATFEASLPTRYWDQMGGEDPWLIAIYAMTGLTVLVEPTFYQRIFAARSYKNVRNALLIGLFIWSAYDWCVTLLGMAAQSGIAAGLVPADVHPNSALLAVVVATVPVGVLGLFIAGVLSTSMSTVDSYCLVAGGNVAYDLYRPIARPEATDQELIKATRWGILLSWVMGFVMAFYFERMLAMWVFIASMLTSTVFVPILLGLYFPRWRRPRAGYYSALAGLGGAILFYVALGSLGGLEDGTRVLTLHLGDQSVRILEEYAMFFTLPLSLSGFVLGLWTSPKEAI
jgi:SSS family solute:Na+ symporter